MEKVLYVGIYEGYPLSIVMVNDILTFRYIDLQGNPDEYQYILETPDDVMEGEDIDDDYQFLRKEMEEHLYMIDNPSEQDIIQALGEILTEWDVDIYSEEGKELDECLQEIWNYYKSIIN